MTAWLEDWPALVAAVGVLTAPGLATGWAAGLRGLLAWGLAGPLSVSILALAAIGGPLLGLAWGPGLALLAAAVAVVLGAALEQLLRRLGGPASGTDRSRTPLAAAGGATVGAAAAAGSVALGLRRPDAIPQTFDAVFHLNAVRHVMTSGDASSLGLGVVSAPERGQVFYPGAWHAATALVAQLAGVAPPTAANAVAVVTAAVLWTSGCVLLVRQVLGPAPMGLLAAGVLSPGLAAAPYLLLSYGTVWPNALGTALLPAALAALVSVAGLGRADLLGRRRGSLVSVAVLPGLVLAHPNVVVALLAWGLVLVPAGAHRWLSAQHQVSRRLVVCVASGVVGYAVLVAWLVMRSPLFAMTRGTDWRHRESLAQATGEWLLAAPCGAPVAVVVAGLVLLGLVVTWRSPLRWLAACHGVTGALWVMAAGSDAPLPQLMTGPWYNDAFRLGALIPVTGVTLAVIGLGRVVEAVAQVPWRRLHETPARWVWGVALVAVVLATQGMSVRDNARVVASWYSASRDRLAGPQERALLERLDSLVPAGTTVAGSPWNGSALGQALSHRSALFPHLLGSWGSDRTLLASSMASASTNPGVCRAARRLRVGYVLDGPSAFWPDDKRQLLYAGLHVAGRPGFEPVATGGRLTLYRVSACGLSGPP